MTTKQCPKCGNKRLVPLPSLNEKRCTDCGAVIKWIKGEQQSDYY